MDIEVTLPNNLVGHVSIVAISEQLTEKLQNATAEEKEDDEDEDEDDSDIDLQTIFNVGEYVRVYVVSTMDETTTGKGKRKIELSLRPTEANTGLGMDDLVPNTTVMASVVSVEDHGCIMDLGISKAKAFLPKNEIPSTIGEERLQPGAVILTSVTGKNGKVAQLSLLDKRIANVNAIPSEATTINTFLPGTTCDVLVTNTDRRGLAGKVLGSLDVTADLIHSGAGPSDVDLENKYKVSSRVKARVICTFPSAKEPKLGISLLPHVTSLGTKMPSKENRAPTDILPISSLVEKCTVRHVEGEIGLFVDVGVPGLAGFVHISRVKDGKVDALFETSGAWKKDSVHKGRVVGYNEVDGIFQLSFEKSVLEQPYIRYDDVPVGTVMTCDIEKLVINEDGVGGLVLKIAEGISGFVPERHLADIRLQHPEKKFREGMKVKARVLSVDPSKKKMRLTMKKTLVNSDAPVLKQLDEVSVGAQAPGTIVKILPKGAFIQFYGNLKGFLPVSEMSEAFIANPADHFRLGQVVSVHILDVDPDTRRLVVSCKDPAAFGLDKQTALRDIQIGHFVSAKVTQKSEDSVHVELVGSLLKAVLPVGHLTDKSISKSQFALKRINVGQTMSELMVIDKDEQRRAITLTQKPSLIEASKNKKLLTSFNKAKEGLVVAGYVRNITLTAVFIQFGGNLNALLPKSRLPAESHTKPDFGLFKHQSMEVRIVSTIQDLQRILVAPSSTPVDEPSTKKQKGPAPDDNLTVGSVAKVRISSVKETQMNVQVVDSTVQGRIDISQIFDSFDEIDNPKEPLTKFHRGQILKAKVMGIHDAKDHRFLPISHRSTHSTLEFSIKGSHLKSEDDPEPLAMEQLRVGDQYFAFVNNLASQYLWVNLSPKVRGRISALEASDDLSLLDNLEENFPLGSALKVRVTAVDAKNNHLDLSARSSTSSAEVTWSSLKKNMVLPGRITRINERQILINLSDQVAGAVHLPDMADDYDEVNTMKYKKNDIVRVSVVDVDTPNKKVRLSLRPSRIMSSTLPVQDKEITEVSQLAPGDIVRGFIKNVAEKGVYVLLGGQVDAMVLISNLSDRFIKNWKDDYQVDQLVKGRVLFADPANKQVRLSLKASALDENYTPPVTIGDLKQGQIITGKVRKVEDFGAFIQVDNSANLSGLCHRSQMADKPVQDATKLYKEGDLVKAIILEIDEKKKRINFGLKPSLFDDEDTDMSDEGAALEAEDDEDEDDDDSDIEMGDGGATLKIVGTDNVDDSDEDEDDDDMGDDDEDEDDSDDEGPSKATGLGAGKKSAWVADPFDNSEAEASDDEKAEEKPKKKRKGTEIEIDRTGDLDANGPQTAFDHERLCLIEPNSSERWIQYMAFQMQVSELAKAREVAEKAIRTIDMTEETEKLAIWAAYLNLEVAYGNKSTVEEVFKRACQVNDEQEVHERLASMYIQSEKLKVCSNSLN